MHVLEKLSQDTERICIELMDVNICNRLKKQHHWMTVQHVAEEYLNIHPITFWEDIVQILGTNFNNIRLARETNKTYITGDLTLGKGKGMGCGSVSYKLPQVYCGVLVT